MSNAIGGTTSSYSPSDSGASSPLTSGTQNLANEQTFLKLLVAQMQNQDPLNPMDGTQFVGQLAQFSQLEQVIQIRQGVDTLASTATANATKNATPAPATVNP